MKTREEEQLISLFMNHYYKNDGFCNCSNCKIVVDKYPKEIKEIFRAGGLEHECDCGEQFPYCRCQEERQQDRDREKIKIEKESVKKILNIS